VAKGNSRKRARSWTDEPDDVANEYFDRVACYGETFTVEDHEVE
jgi:hypothetical protein